MGFGELGFSQSGLNYTSEYLYNCKRQNPSNPSILQVDKKAVLSQRWPRAARYISRSWAVAEIWPFEIIQDGGGRHLEFVLIENSAIRSDVPENPTYNQT